MSSTLVLNADRQPISLLPISTMDWRDAIRAVYVDSVTILREYDRWDVHSPSVTMTVPSVVMTKTYLHINRRVGWSDRHVFLRDRYRCQYCNEKFPERELTLDHVVPRKFGGKTNWTNIATACAPCNSARGCDTRIQPRTMPHEPTYWELLARRQESEIIVPHESWVEFITWPDDKIIVSGEKYKLRSRRAA